MINLNRAGACGLAVALALGGWQRGAEGAPAGLGKVQTTTGTLQGQPSGSQTPGALAVGDAIYPGELIATGANAKATLLFDDGSQALMNAGSLIECGERGKSHGPAALFRVLKGEVVARLQTGTSVQTAAATAVVRGTELDLRVDPQDNATLTVLQGTVDFFNQFGSVAVDDHQVSVARPGHAPSAPITVDNSGFIVEWSLQLARVAISRELFHHTVDRRAAARQASRFEATGNATPHDRLDLGDWLFDSGDFEGALRTYRLAGAAFDRHGTAAVEPELAVRIGDALQELMRLDEAGAAYDLVREPTSGSADASVNEYVRAQLGLSWVELRRDRPAAAEQKARVVLKWAPQSSEGAVALGVSLLRQPGRAAEAARTLADAAQARPDTFRYQVHAWLALADLDLGREAALPEAIGAVRLEPNSSLARSNLALAHLFKNDTESALREAIRANELNPAEPAAAIVLAQAHLGAGDVEAGFRAAAKAVAFDRNSPQAHYVLAIAQAQRGDYSHARRELGESLRLAPDFLEAGQALARVEVAMGHPRIGEQLLKDQLARFPQSPIVLAGLADIYHAEGDYGRAIETYRLALEHDPGSALDYAGLMRASLDTNRLGEAIEAGRQAVALAPQVGQYHALLGLAYDFSGLSAPAEREYRTAIAYDAGNALARARLGLAASDPLTKVDTFGQAFLFDPTVSSQLMRGGIDTEMTPSMGNDGQRDLSVLHRAVGDAGAFHVLAGGATSGDDGNPRVQNNRGNSYNLRQDSTYVPRPGTNLYFNVIHGGLKEGLPGLALTPFGADPDASSRTVFDQGIVAWRQQIRERSHLWASFTEQRLHTQLGNGPVPFPLPFPLPVDTGSAFPFTGESQVHRAVIPEMRYDVPWGDSLRRPSLLTLGASAGRLRDDVSTGPLTLQRTNFLPVQFASSAATANDRFSTAYAQFSQRRNSRLSLIAELRQDNQGTRNSLLVDGQPQLIPGTASHRLNANALVNYQLDARSFLRLSTSALNATTNMVLAPTETSLTIEPDILAHGGFANSGSTQRITELDFEHYHGTHGFSKLFLFDARAHDLQIGDDATVYAYRVSGAILVSRLRQDGLGFRYEHALSRRLYARSSLLAQTTSNRSPGQAFSGGQAPYYPNRTADAALYYVGSNGIKASLIANHFGWFFDDNPSNLLGFPAGLPRPVYGAHTYISCSLSREPTVHCETFISVVNIFNSPSIVFNGVPTISDPFGTGRRRVLAGVTLRL